MKNITVTLDDETAAWARQYASRENKSLSRFLGELLHKTMHESSAYENAMRRYLAKKPFAPSRADQPYPTREDLYDRPKVR